MYYLFIQVYGITLIVSIIFFCLGWLFYKHFFIRKNNSKDNTSDLILSLDNKISTFIAEQGSTFNKFKDAGLEEIKELMSQFKNDPPSYSSADLDEEKHHSYADNILPSLNAVNDQIEMLKIGQTNNINKLDVVLKNQDSFRDYYNYWNKEISGDLIQFLDKKVSTIFDEQSNIYNGQNGDSKNIDREEIDKLISKFEKIGLLHNSADPFDEEKFNSFSDSMKSSLNVINNQIESLKTEQCHNIDRLEDALKDKDFSNNHHNYSDTEISNNNLIQFLDVKMSKILDEQLSTYSDESKNANREEIEKLVSKFENVRPLLNSAALYEEKFDSFSNSMKSSLNVINNQIEILKTEHSNNIDRLEDVLKDKDFSNDHHSYSNTEISNNIIQFVDKKMSEILDGRIDRYNNESKNDNLEETEKLLSKFEELRPLLNSTALDEEKFHNFSNSIKTALNMINNQIEILKTEHSNNIQKLEDALKDNDSSKDHYNELNTEITNNLIQFLDKRVTALINEQFNSNNNDESNNTDREEIRNLLLQFKDAQSTCHSSVLSEERFMIFADSIGLSIDSVHKQIEMLKSDNANNSTKPTDSIDNQDELVSINEVHKLSKLYGIGPEKERILNDKFKIYSLEDLLLIDSATNEQITKSLYPYGNIKINWIVWARQIIENNGQVTNNFITPDRSTIKKAKVEDTDDEINYRLTTLFGIGPSKEKILKEKFNICSLKDLLLITPSQNKSITKLLYPHNKNNSIDWIKRAKQAIKNIDILVDQYQFDESA